MQCNVFLFITIKATTREFIYITMYHLQRERTEGYRAPIANGTNNSTMISNKKHYNKKQHLWANINCSYPAHICKSNQPYPKPII